MAFYTIYTASLCKSELSCTTWHWDTFPLHAMWMKLTDLPHGVPSNHRNFPGLCEHHVISLTSLPAIFSLSHIQPSSLPQTHQLSPPVTFLLTCLHGHAGSFAYADLSSLERPLLVLHISCSLLPHFLPFYGKSHYLLFVPLFPERVDKYILCALYQGSPCSSVYLHHLQHVHSKWNE